MNREQQILDTLSSIVESEKQAKASNTDVDIHAKLKEMSEDELVAVVKHANMLIEQYEGKRRQIKEMMSIEKEQSMSIEEMFNNMI